MRRLTRWLVVALLAIVAVPPGPVAAFDAELESLTIVEDLELNDLTLELMPAIGHLAASEVAAVGVCFSPAELLEDPRAYAPPAAAERLVVTRKPQPRDAIHRVLEPPLHQRGIFE